MDNRTQTISPQLQQHRTGPGQNPGGQSRLHRRRPASARKAAARQERPQAKAMPVAVQQGRLHSGLLITTIIMICFGLVMLFSASMSDGYANKEGNPMYYVLRQASITGAGLLAALIIGLFFSIRFFDKMIFTVGLYSVTSVLLLLVKIKGEITNGGQRWLELGPVRFQPSELAKLAAVFCFAGYVSWVSRRRANGKFQARGPVRQVLLDAFVDILFPATALLVWAGLILWQPHLSGFVIMCFIIMSVFLAAGIRFRTYLVSFTLVVVLLLAVGLILATALPIFMPKEQLTAAIEENFAHVQKRIDTFQNPEEASADDVYQITQSMIAIGSGGLTGLGLGEGRQKYNYLPESHNDFVFAIIGEELGFIGTVSVVLLFVAFLIFGVSIAMRAATPFATILASGYTMLIVVQAFLNIGVTTWLLPTTGISLPFFSYGGTANFFFLIAIGFILCASRTGQRQSLRQI